MEELQRLAHIGLWEWDIVNDKVTWSSELYRIYGVPPETSPRSYGGYLERVHPEDRPAMDAAVRAAFERGEPYSLDHRILRADGATRIVHARGQAVRGANGAIVKLVGTSQDVTETRAAEERAAEADRLREADMFRTQFISKAAHELRTPLLPIRVQAHLLRGAVEPTGDPAAVKALNALERNLERLNRLVDELLEASRLQNNRLKLDRSPFDVSALLDEAHESFHPVAQQLGIRLLWRPRPGHVVDADPQRILQVMHNLLGNAMKFTPAGGTVTVEVERQGTVVRVRVRDTGSGIQPGELGTLFQPFSQTTAARRTAAPGSGLGLYISRGIVDEHGGRIWAESAGPDQGATFIVELPFSDKQPQPLDVRMAASAWWHDAAPTGRSQRLKDLI